MGGVYLEQSRKLKALALLVDLHDGASTEEVRLARDALNATLEDIFKNAPRTSIKAYEAAQKALKLAEELYFSEEELDKMLPMRLRNQVKPQIFDACHALKAIANQLLFGGAIHFLDQEYSSRGDVGIN